MQSPRATAMATHILYARAHTPRTDDLDDDVRHSCPFQAQFIDQEILGGTRWISDATRVSRQYRDVQAATANDNAGIALSL